MIDWSIVGTVLGGVVVAVISYLTGRGKRQVASASDGAEADVIGMMRAEVKRLASRVEALEGREGRLIRHVYRLEGLMAGAGMTPPPFEIDGPTIHPVGSP